MENIDNFQDINMENGEKYYSEHRVHHTTPQHETEMDYSELPCDVELVEAFEGGLQILIGIREQDRRGF